MGSNSQGPAGGAGGAPRAQRAVPARGPEYGVTTRADRPGHPGRANRATTAVINTEVIDGETPGDRSAQGRGLDPIDDGATSSR